MLALCVTASAVSASPNIIHIFADDFGYGNATFNQPTTQLLTPNLQRLRDSGMNFTNAYSCSLCSPSRASLMTGLHQGHANNDRNVRLFRADEVMLPALLSSAGYNTGLFGKWGFGGSAGTTTTPNAEDDGNLRANPSVTDVNTLPTTHGFQTFYGELNHSRAHQYFVDSFFTTTPVAGQTPVGGLYVTPSGNTLVGGVSGTNTFTNYSHDAYAAASEQYIRDRATGTQPFYAQVNYTIPHFDITSIERVPGYFNDYAGVPGSAGWTQAEKGYAAMITRMDKSIGRILDLVNDPNGDGNNSDSIAANTLIMFASDNGGDANGANSRFQHNGTFRGDKGQLWEGGIHTPLVASWAGRIAPGSTSAMRTDLSDFMPTIAELAGLTDEVPVGIDGVSIAPTLTGSGRQRSRGHFVFEQLDDAGDGTGNTPLWTVLRGDYKLIKRRNLTTSSIDYILTNLATDPSEQNPLSLSVAANASIKTELEAIAMAEGAEQPAGYSVQYLRFTGGSSTSLQNATLWGGTVPDARASAIVHNTASTSSVVTSGGSLSVLGLEVRGNASAKQTVRVDPLTTLTARNQLRVASSGRLHLDDAAVDTTRWIDLLPGSELTGHGTLSGTIYNNGARLAPGLPADLSAPPVSPPVNTGVLPAVVFNFAGIQDQSISATSTLNSNVVVSSPLYFGPGTQERANDFNDQGSELNVQGWTIGGTLSDAIANSDYVSFAASPVAGIEMKLATARFTLWRNGTGAPPNYAILSSVDGFSATNALGTYNVAGSGNSGSPSTLTATYAGNQWIRSAIEVRLYGWGANGANSHSHLTAASMDASFRSIPGSTVTIDSTGTLTLNGDYIHSANSTLAIDLGGLSTANANNPQYDRLIVNGAAELAGTIDIHFVDGFVGLPGSSYDVLWYAQRMGAFDTIGNSTGFAGLHLNPTYSADHLTIALSALPGDANLDAAVSFDDLLALAQSYGMSGRNWLNGDFDANGVVDFTDLLALAQNYDSTGSFNSDWVLAQQLIPEPGAIVLAACGVGTIAGRQRSRRRA